MRNPKTWRRGVLVAIAIATASSIPTAEAASAASNLDPSVEPCALGKLPRALEETVPNGIARAEDRFAGRLGGVQAPDRRRARRLFAASEAAYLYGLPLVAARLTVDRFPLNTLIGVGALATPDSQAVVAPNSDTLYSVARIELESGPMVLDAPASGGRYSVMQLLDAYTNAIDYVGSGSERDRAGSVLLAGPGWDGDAPPGVRVLRSPTNLVWLLGRTLVDGEADVPAATELMGRYALTSLPDWEQGTRAHEVVIPTGAQPPIEVPSGAEFYDALGAELATSAPPARDGCAIEAFARAGIAAGAQPTADPDPIAAAALEAAAKAGSRLIDRAVARMRDRSRKHHAGWALPLADTARFRRDYANRAVIARNLLGANTAEEALYPEADVDYDGRALKGRHRYVIRIDADELPPVRAFWSMTMYDEDYYLVDNPIDRYAVGDRTPGLDYGRDGSLTIYLQHEPPRGAKLDNWLPAPAGRFSLRLRLFEPKRAALSGRWEPPEVRRALVR